MDNRGKNYSENGFFSNFINTFTKSISNEYFQIKLAKILSNVLTAPLIAIPIFILINYISILGIPPRSSITTSVIINTTITPITSFIIVESISLIFATIIPLLTILLWVKYKNSDYEISNKEDRFYPLLIAGLLYLFAGALLFFLNLSQLATILMFAYGINTLITLLITLKWKISIHTMGVAGPAAVLIFCFAGLGASVGLLIPVIMWARVKLKKHTMSQVIMGAIIGFLLTFLELYFLPGLFGYQNIINLIATQFASSLNSILAFISSFIWYPAAIIGPALIMSIMGYLNDNGWKDGDTRKLFHITGFIAFTVFLAFASFDAIIILILSGIVSIAIAIFGGEEFLWFKGIGRNSDRGEKQTYVILPLLCSGLWLILALFIFSKEIAIIATLCVALGDALAEPVGIRFGKHKYNVKAIKGSSSQKSIEGSLAVFVVCTIIILIFTLNPVLAISLGAILSIVEGISPRGTDNITIPAVAAIILSILPTILII